MTTQADQMMEQLPPFFDVNVLAQVLGVSVSTARRIMNQPGFPVWRISQRKHRIYREPFLRWVQNQIEAQVYASSPSPLTAWSTSLASFKKDL